MPSPKLKEFKVLIPNLPDTWQDVYFVLFLPGPTCSDLQASVSFLLGISKIHILFFKKTPVTSLCPSE